LGCWLADRSRPKRMGRKFTRWPIWKIAVSTAACAAGAVALFWLSVVMGALGGEQTRDPTQPQMLALPTFIMILGVATAMLAILGAVWLGVRIQEARTPPWKRGKKSRRH
jgi:protein-S-isoprenylcysteine O-methyltransferase Ste14